MLDVAIAALDGTIVSLNAAIAAIHTTSAIHTTVVSGARDTGGAVTVATEVTTIPTVMHTKVLSVGCTEVVAVSVIVSSSAYSVPGVGTAIGVEEERTTKIEVVTIRVAGIDIVLLLAALIWGLWSTHQKEISLQSKIAFLVCTALLGIPFYGHGAGSFVIGILVLVLLAAILFSYIGKNVSSRLLNTALLCMTLITVGYSSYAVIVIRSTANPPMDQNSPEDVFTLAE